MSGAKGERKAGQPRGKTQMEDLMGLPAGYRMLRYRKDGEHDTAHVGREGVPEGQRTCPRCGARGQGSGKAWRKVWHAPLRGVPLMLMVRTRRLRCPECGKCWSEDHSALVGEASIHMTHEVQDAVLVDLMDRMSIAATAHKEGPSPCMVARVPGRATVDSAYLPRHLRTAGFKANTELGKMAVAISDGDTGVPGGILPRAKKEVVARWFASFSPEERGRVERCCCDMSGVFLPLQREYFPHATLCVDRFHVVKLVTKALDDVRKRHQKDKELNGKWREDVRKSWRLFPAKREELERIDLEYSERLATQRRTLMATFDIGEEELADIAKLKPREGRLHKVDRLLEGSGELKAAYELLHLFYRWSDTPWSAKKRDGLSRWCSLARSSGVPEMRVAAESLRTYREGVLNGYRTGKTNATAEGINNTIKVVKRVSYGFKDFRRMRRRCLLACGFYKIVKRETRLGDVGPDGDLT